MFNEDDSTRQTTTVNTNWNFSLAIGRLYVRLSLLQLTDLFKVRNHGAHKKRTHPDCKRDFRCRNYATVRGAVEIVFMGRKDAQGQNSYFCSFFEASFSLFLQTHVLAGPQDSGIIGFCAPDRENDKRLPSGIRKTRGKDRRRMTPDVIKTILKPSAYEEEN